LSKDANRAFQSKDFLFQKVYGLSIQFSADKNKFYTNLYMNIPDNKNKASVLADSDYMDSLNRK
jgi:hypothetical protein